MLALPMTLRCGPDKVLSDAGSEPGTESTAFSGKSDPVNDVVSERAQLRLFVSVKHDRFLSPPPGDGHMGSD